MVQWLGLGTFTAVDWVQSLTRKLISCKPCTADKKKRLCNFKTSYRLTVSKQYSTSIIMWTNRTEKRTKKYSSYVWSDGFQQGPRPFNGKEESVQQMVLENGIPRCKRMKLNPYLIPYTKLNSKWIEELNLRVKTFAVSHTGLSLPSF